MMDEREKGNLLDVDMRGKRDDACFEMMTK